MCGFFDTYRRSKSGLSTRTHTHTQAAQRPRFPVPFAVEKKKIDETISFRKKGLSRAHNTGVRNRVYTSMLHTSATRGITMHCANRVYTIILDVGRAVNVATVGRRSAIRFHAARISHREIFARDFRPGRLPRVFPGSHDEFPTRVSAARRNVLRGAE